jgi:hydroxyacylglutathione hydrolase
MDDYTIKRIVVGTLSANCYIIGSPITGEGLIIDPGGDAQEIIHVVNQTQLEISNIVLTHGHSDHIAALYEIQRHTRAAVAIHRADENFFHGYGEFSMMFGISYKTPAPPERLLVEGDIIKIGDMCFKVIHTPGHTPGSICLLIENKVFTGDTLMYHSIGTTLMPGSSRRQLIDSIHSRLMVLPDDTQVYPGHGRQTTIGAERLNNPYI